MVLRRKGGRNSPHRPLTFPLLPDSRERRINPPLPQWSSFIAIRNVLLAIIAAIAMVFAIGWWRAAELEEQGRRWAAPVQIAIGFITDFLDTLGIGSFATTTAFYKMFN